VATEGACTVWARSGSSLELLRHAVALRRHVLRTAAPGHSTLDAQRMLADQLYALGAVWYCHPSKEVTEAEACLREALALCEGLEDAFLTGKTLSLVINLCGEAHAMVGPAEAETFRVRLNQLLVQMCREPETSCSICLEPLAPSADGAAEDAAGLGGTGPSDSCVRVLECYHQLHYGCSMSWRNTASNWQECPLCRM